jgi:hypothetical protein
MCRECGQSQAYDAVAEDPNDYEQALPTITPVGEHHDKHEEQGFDRNSAE